MEVLCYRVSSLACTVSLPVTEPDHETHVLVEHGQDERALPFPV
jgi:hypothetical protein